MTPVTRVMIGDVLDFNEDEDAQAIEDSGVDTESPFEVVDYVENEDSVSLYDGDDHEVSFPYDHICRVSAS